MSTTPFPDKIQGSLHYFFSIRLNSLKFFVIFNVVVMLQTSNYICTDKLTS